MAFCVSQNLRGRGIAPGALSHENLRTAVTTSDRNVGSIVVNSRSRPERRRFTLAHELGHFLNLWHQPQGPMGSFSCTESDLGRGWRSRPTAVSRHVNQETQANRFAIELLAPARLVRPHLYGIPDLEKVLSMATALAINREAAARRYAELHEQPTALVFSTEGCVRYVERHPEFPFVACRRGQPLFDLPESSGDDKISAHVEADPKDWLGRDEKAALLAQTLRQSGGYAITLLVLDKTEDDEGQ
jgi:hypothetical protein